MYLLVSMTRTCIKPSVAHDHFPRTGLIQIISVGEILISSIMIRMRTFKNLKSTYNGRRDISDNMLVALLVFSQSLIS